MKKGFTLLELIVVIIIIGILATLGFTQYTKIVEKARTAEAKVALGQIRSAQFAYLLEYSAYGAAIANLVVDAPTACASTHWFWFGTNTAGPSTATRCTGGGKAPQGASLYSIALSHAGVFTGDAGYY